ncbi:MAG: RNA polymerase sigma factor [Phycisphaerae bacterium]
MPACTADHRADVERCFAAHRARVYRWAFGLCGRHDDALDALQDVFVRLLHAGVRFESDGAARAWLRRATSSVIIDRWRSARERVRRERAVALERFGEAQTPATPGAADEAAIVRAAIAALSEQQRLVLLAKCFDECSFGEVAAELGIAVSTAKTHYLRALDAIRARLAPGVSETHS